MRAPSAPSRGPARPPSRRTPGPGWTRAPRPGTRSGCQCLTGSGAGSASYSTPPPEARPSPPLCRWPWAPWLPACLLQVGGRSCFLETGDGLLGVGLADVLEHGLWRGVDQVLGLLEAELGELAHGLDHVDLALADLRQRDRDLGCHVITPPPLFLCMRSALR